jgi:4-amino-4-deoxy-L-arabinose transferase-like glycosyltransferase
MDALARGDSPSRRLDTAIRTLLRNDRRTAALLAVMTFLTLAGLSTWLHPFEIPNYENDRYHLMADRLLAGEWPHDVYRPMLYVLLTAGVGSLTGDCFLAGKLVSALGGGLLVFATHRLARIAFGRRTAISAALLVAVSPIAIRYGLIAGTDALSVALSTLCLAAALAAAARSGSRTAALAGAAFALAYWCRYQTVALLPVALIGVWLGSMHGERLRRLTAFATATAVGLVPHMTLCWLQFGKPLHDENWRNVALRHFSPNLDFTYLQTNPFDGLLSVLRHDPAVILRHAALEAQGMVHWGLRNLIVGPEGNSLLGSVLFSLVLLGAAIGWTRRPRYVGLTLLAACAYLSLVALTFFGWERMLLPVLPIQLSVLAYLMVVGIPRMATAARASSLRPRLVAGLPTAAAAALLWTAIPATEAFAAAQPTRAVEVTRDLVARHGEDIGIISDYAFLSRHCGGRHWHAWLGADPASTLTEMQFPTGDWHWFMACKAASDDESWKKLATAKLPAWLVPAIEEPTVRVWRIAR